MGSCLPCEESPADDVVVCSRIGEAAVRYSGRPALLPRAATSPRLWRYSRVLVNTMGRPEKCSHGPMTFNRVHRSKVIPVLSALVRI